MTEPQPTPAARARPRARASVVGIIGEVLVTAGVLVLLFVAWQVGWNTWVLNDQQSSSASSLGKELLKQSQAAPSTVPTPSDSPASTAVDNVVPVAAEPANTKPIGVVYIPAFGSDWKRTIRQSVDAVSVLNSATAGVGHYPGTAMPGGVGNFAIAAHDTGWGDAFRYLQDLKIGDKVYIQTADGFYTYEFRNLEYVQPNAVSVLLPVPRQPDAQPKDRLITMTTCNPAYHGVERVIAYGTFDGFSPTVPTEIAAEVG